MLKIFFTFTLLFSLHHLNAENISVMSINAQNLFDTIDDPGKDDKAFLPIEMKQSKKHKNSCNSITVKSCLLYTSPSPRDRTRSRMPSSA